MEVRNSLASLSDGGTGGGGASSVVVNQKVQNFNQLIGQGFGGNTMAVMFAFSEGLRLGLRILTNSAFPNSSVYK